MQPIQPGDVPDDVEVLATDLGGLVEFVVNEAPSSVIHALIAKAADVCVEHVVAHQTGEDTNPECPASGEGGPDRAWDLTFRMLEEAIEEAKARVWATYHEAIEAQVFEIQAMAEIEDLTA